MNHDTVDAIDRLNLRLLRVKALTKAIQVGEDMLDLESMITLADMAEGQAEEAMSLLDSWAGGYAREGKG